eukprot:578421-Rhodomonas_salina.2
MPSPIAEHGPNISESRSHRKKILQQVDSSSHMAMVGFGLGARQLLSFVPDRYGDGTAHQGAQQNLKPT